MSLSVKLEVFEGPLDLLLHLIDKNKIDIYDIPIVEITAQYMEYIKQLETEDMNLSAASTNPRPPFTGAVFPLTLPAPLCTV